MRIALVVPGGVNRDGEHRVIPALLWLIERLARRHDVEVIALRQEVKRDVWNLFGATVRSVGPRPRGPRALDLILQASPTTPVRRVSLDLGGRARRGRAHRRSPLP